MVKDVAPTGIPLSPEVLPDPLAGAPTGPYLPPSNTASEHVAPPGRDDNCNDAVKDWSLQRRSPTSYNYESYAVTASELYLTRDIRIAQSFLNLNDCADFLIKEDAKVAED